MAKKPVKEAGTALIFATVFFVLTTIALGVLWYTEMNNKAQKDQAVDNSKKDVAAATSVLADAKLDATITRLYFGVADDADRSAVSGWSDKEKKRAGETIKKNTQLMADKLAKGDVSGLPPELKLWTVDAAGLPESLPDSSPLSVITTLANARDTAKSDAEKATALFEAAAAAQKTQEQSYIAMAKKFEDLTKALPVQYRTEIEAEIKKFTDRAKAFTVAEAASRAENQVLNDKIADLGREKSKLGRTIEGMQEQIESLLGRLQTARNEDTFINDEPHGKILRRLPEGIVELNIGSDALVRPGLTFTVLPQDFPEKGRQSRIMRVREPDERGNYKTVERFIEKANIEVIEVLGPKLSRARVTKEFDPIRDGAGPGDLIYNAVWRKGAADRIALIGVFDANGDGSDDIESVIRDLTRMGVPVDAYYDLRTRKWVGELTQHTRFIVEGWYPVQSGLDPNREEKTKILGDMDAAIKEAQGKGISTIKFQDFFPRTGYRMKIDTTKDKVNQAYAPYLNKVSSSDAPPPGN